MRQDRGECPRIASTTSLPLRAAETAPAGFAIDGDVNTFWHTEWGFPTDPLPHEFTVDLGTPEIITGFAYTARQDGSPNGRIGDWEFVVSNDGENWCAPVVPGTLANVFLRQTVTF